MHMDISQGNFYARIYSQKTGGQMEHPDLPPAVNTTLMLQELLSVDTLFGGKLFTHCGAKCWQMLNCWGQTMGDADAAT